MKRTLHGMLTLVAVFLLNVPDGSRAGRSRDDQRRRQGHRRRRRAGRHRDRSPTSSTNLESHQATTETGAYQVVNLIPGRYQVDVELTGFKKSSQVVTLEVGQRARLDVELAIGSLSETVTVAETPQLLNTNDATLGAVIPQMQVANLPLAIRNWDDLLALVPGVQGDRYTEQGGGTSFGRTGGINVHGARALQNNFLLDGVDNNSISENVQELTTQVSRPSVDAIQEFKVVTSPYSAEYGRSPGAAVSVSTKSGTNAFKGTVYEYFRNDKFDSIDYFSQRAGAAEAEKRSEPVRRQHRRSGGQGRGFFFADYEGTRITRGVTRLTRGADRRRARRHLYHRGPRSAHRPAVRQQHDSGHPHRSVRRGDHRTWCRCRTSPAPTTSSAPPICSTTPTGCSSRADWKPDSSDSIFGRYIYSNRTRQIPGAFGGVVDGTGTSAFGNQTIATNALVGGWTKVVSSNKVNEFRFSWSRSTSDAVQQSFGSTPPAGGDDSRQRDQSDRIRRPARHRHRYLLRRLRAGPHRVA